MSLTLLHRESDFVCKPQTQKLFYQHQVSVCPPWGRRLSRARLSSCACAEDRVHSEAGGPQRILPGAAGGHAGPEAGQGGTASGRGRSGSDQRTLLGFLAVVQGAELTSSLGSALAGHGAKACKLREVGTHLQESPSHFCTGQTRAPVSLCFSRVSWPLETLRTALWGHLAALRALRRPACSSMCATLALTLGPACCTHPGCWRVLPRQVGEGSSATMPFVLGRGDPRLIFCVFCGMLA